MNLIKAGAQQPESFIMPSDVFKKCVFVAGKVAFKRECLCDLCLLETTVTSQVSIPGWESKGLTFNPVVLTKLISFPI